MDKFKKSPSKNGQVQKSHIVKMDNAAVDNK